jgi:hypothetical protein
MHAVIYVLNVLYSYFVNQIKVKKTTMKRKSAMPVSVRQRIKQVRAAAMKKAADNAA